MILAQFQFLGTTMRGVMTNVYGTFQTNHKVTFLEEIHSIQEWVGTDIWVIGGDFNIIKSLEEKKVGAVRSLSNASSTFNKLIEDLQLVYIRTINSLITW